MYGLDLTSPPFSSGPRTASLRGNNRSSVIASACSIISIAFNLDNDGISDPPSLILLTQLVNDKKNLFCCSRPMLLQPLRSISPRRTFLLVALLHSRPRFPHNRPNCSMTRSFSESLSPSAAELCSGWWFLVEGIGKW